MFGARGSDFARTILRLAQERETLAVVDDQVGSPTPAALVATVTGIVLAMLRQGRAMADDERRLYHLCCGRPVSWHEFVTTIVALAGAMSGLDLSLTPAAIRRIATRELPDAGTAPGQLTPRLHPPGDRLRTADAGLAALSGTHAGTARAEEERLLTWNGY